MKNGSLIQYRVEQLEEGQEDHERRVRALELSYAKMLGWCAGGAFVGGLAWTAVVTIIQWARG